MKFGAYLFEPKTVEGFDLQVHRVKPEAGGINPIMENIISQIACFGDNVTAEQRPDWVAVSRYGPATRKNKRYNFRWDILCMTNQEYRKQLYELIDKAAEKSPEVSISSIHFADDGFCVCPRCIELWRQSGLNWIDWRTKTVTEFVREVREIVKKHNKPLHVGLLPDPALSKLRFGIDFDQLAEYADTFQVPLFSKTYATAWYFETLARDFKRILKKPVFVHLYVYGPGDNPNEVPTVKELLTVSVRIARTGVDGILYLADTAERLRAFQKAAVEAVDVRKSLEGYGGDEFLKLVEKWESLF